MYKGILFFDIDGTLVDSNNKERMPSASALRAIAKAKENGYLCMICSGRSLAGLRQFHDIGMDGFIFSDGAGFAAEGQDIILDPIDPEVLKRLTHQVIEEYHGEMLMSTLDGCYASEGQYTAMWNYIEQINRAIKEAGRTDFAYMRRIEEYAGEPVLEIDITFPHKRIEAEWVANMDPALEYISTSETYGLGEMTVGEVTACGMTKGNRALDVAERYGIPGECTYAFGDSMNDASMLRACGHGICMGNGAQQLKDLAEYVTDSIENDGLAKAMMHYGIIEEY